MLQFTCMNDYTWTWRDTLWLLPCSFMFNTFSWGICIMLISLHYTPSAHDNPGSTIHSNEWRLFEIIFVIPWYFLCAFLCDNVFTVWLIILVSLVNTYHLNYQWKNIRSLWFLSTSCEILFFSLSFYLLEKPYCLFSRLYGSYFTM